MAQAGNSPVCQPEECFSFPHLVPQHEAEAVPQFLSGLALPFLPNSTLNSPSWRKMCLKTKGFYTLLARIKIQMKSETWGRWEHLTLCLSQWQDAEDHKSHLVLKNINVQLSSLAKLIFYLSELCIIIFTYLKYRQNSF